MNNILIADDNPSDSHKIQELATELGCSSNCVTSATEANRLLQHQHYDLLICALPLIQDETQNLITAAKQTPVLMTLPPGSDINTAVNAMSKGAAYCVAKPLDHNEIKRAAQRLLASQMSTLTNNVTPLPQMPNDKAGAEPVAGMIGSSPAMCEVYRRIRKAGPTRSTVLIRGETGTGKELVARAIHDSSERKNHPFIAVNCAAIPETLIESELFGHEKGSFTGAAVKRTGLIEAAEGGTLFLDEIGELPSEAQARLLRFIQESEIRRVGSNESHPVNVRLVAATHRDLQAQTKSGHFRDDLYYRINVFRIFLPALRQRGNDLLEIADHLLTQAALRHGKDGLYLTPEAIHALSHYNWPGNVRELENVVERATIMADDLAIDSVALEIDTDISSKTIDFSTARQTLPEQQYEGIRSQRPSKQVEDPQAGLSLEDYFQRFVLEHQEQMNETELAKKLGISRKCLWERRQRFGIPRSKSIADSGNKTGK